MVRRYYSRELAPQLCPVGGVVPRYVFEVRVAGAIRVRAADEAEARKVVFAVLLLPGPDEVRMANDNNARIGWDGTIASVNSV
jgi:hypothetical protein